MEFHIAAIDSHSEFVLWAIFGSKRSSSSSSLRSFASQLVDWFDVALPRRSEPFMLLGRKPSNGA